jgi:hypothetical protein
MTLLTEWWTVLGGTTEELPQIDAGFGADVLRIDPPDWDKPSLS